ncbi:TetR/AcrR family transcriptional regulator [Geodermatophilus sp. SYSU D00697]
MSEQNDRRAGKKAQTRALIRDTARRLFTERGFEAVTIVDIAGAADVAVQTVFNHFASKEDLFFDGRTPWVEGPAEAVRTRPEGVPPLDALHGYLTSRVGLQVHTLATPEGREYVTAVEASPTLCARERELHHASTALLAEALLEAWAQEGTAPSLPSDPRTAASVTAAVWLAAVRTLIYEQRRGLGQGAASGDPVQGAAVACTEADHVLSGLTAMTRAPRLRRTG